MNKELTQHLTDKDIAIINVPGLDLKPDYIQHCFTAEELEIMNRLQKVDPVEVPPADAERKRILEENQG